MAPAAQRPPQYRRKGRDAIATNDSSRLEVRRPAGDVALLDAGDGHAPLVALIVEVSAAEWPGTEVTVRRFMTDSWALDVGLGLLRGISVHVIAKAGPGPIAALVTIAPHTKLASALTIASGLSFFFVGLGGMLYFFLFAGVSGKLAILFGLAAGAVIAGPLFGLAWLVDNVLNPFGPRAVARFRDELAARVGASFPPAP